MTTLQPPKTKESFETLLSSWKSGTRVLVDPIPEALSAYVEVIEANFAAVRVSPLPKTSSIDSFIEELNAEIPGFKQGMSEAYQRLATTMYADEPESFSALRLSVGLSQSDLAIKADTSQPYIARIESCDVDPGTRVISKLAHALEVTPERVLRAILVQQENRAKK